MAKKQTVTARRPKTIKPADRIDVRGARASYGQMVALGRVLDDKTLDDVARLKALIRALHPDVEPAVNFDNLTYAVEIARGVLHWREQEDKRLKYEPSTDEKAAGFAQMAATVGPRGVAVSIGKDFSEIPDKVFDWPFGTVFTVLEVDLQRFKFNKRLNEIRERKREQKERAAKNKGHGRRRR